jgi:hypothetical protein
MPDHRTIPAAPPHANEPEALTPEEQARLAIFSQLAQQGDESPEIGQQDLYSMINSRASGILVRKANPFGPRGLGTWVFGWIEDRVPAAFDKIPNPARPDVWEIKPHTGRDGIAAEYVWQGNPELEKEAWVYRSSDNAAENAMYRFARGFAEIHDKAYNFVFGTIPGGKALHKALFGMEFEPNTPRYNLGRESYGQYQSRVTLGFMGMGLADDTWTHWGANIRGMREYWDDIALAEGIGGKLQKVLSFNPAKLLWNEVKWLAWDIPRNVLADWHVGLTYLDVKRQGQEKQQEVDRVFRRAADGTAQAILDVDQEPLSIQTFEGAKHFYALPFVYYNAYVYGVHNTLVDQMVDKINGTQDGDWQRYMQRGNETSTALSWPKKILNKAMDAIGFAGQKAVEVNTTMWGPALLFAGLRYHALRQYNQEIEERRIVKQELRVEERATTLLGAYEGKLTTHDLELGRTRIGEYTHQLYQAKETLCSERTEQAANAYLDAKRNLIRGFDPRFYSPENYAEKPSSDPTHNPGIVIQHVGELAEKAGLNAQEQRDLTLYLQRDVVQHLRGSREYKAFREHSVRAASPRELRKLPMPPIPDSLKQHSDLVSYGIGLVELCHAQTSRALYHKTPDLSPVEQMAKGWIELNFSVMERLDPFAKHVSTDGKSIRTQLDSYVTTLKEKKGHLPKDWEQEFDLRADRIRVVQKHAADQGSYGIYIGAKGAANVLSRGYAPFNGHWFGDAVRAMQFHAPDTAGEHGNNAPARATSFSALLQKEQSLASSAREQDKIRSPREAIASHTGSLSEQASRIPNAHPSL